MISLIAERECDLVHKFSDWFLIGALAASRPVIGKKAKLFPNADMWMGGLVGIYGGYFLLLLLSAEYNGWKRDIGT